MSILKTKVKIIIAAHKPYWMPQDDLYVPMQVGAYGKEGIGFVRDDSGENISPKNPSFCELTGLYWAWKNLDCDYLGLAHYRRHFSSKSWFWKKINHRQDVVLSSQDMKDLVPRYRVLLPGKRHYYIETLYTHYAHTHYAEHLDLTRRIIVRQCPEYIASFDQVMSHTSGYMFNMYVMEKSLSDAYCAWLFPILFELETKMIARELSQYQGRFYGRVSEILFNVWLEYQFQTGNIQRSEIRELSCVHMEKINWWKKGISFLKAKFVHMRYEGSF